jgi:hypothetical protein
MSQFIQTDFWEMELAEEWDAEQDEETILVSDADGVSLIELTALARPSDANNEDALADLASELLAEGLKPEPAKVGAFEGWVFQFSDEEGGSFREWYLFHKDFVLLISHGTDAEHAGWDDDVVDEMLATLAPVEGGGELGAE